MDGLEKRKTKGRYSKAACVAELPPQCKGAVVEFTVRRRRYSVDVSAMSQKSLDKGTRRQVMRTGAVWFYGASASSNASGLDADHAAGARWSRYETALQRLLEEAYQEHSAAGGRKRGAEGAKEGSGDGPREAMVSEQAAALVEAATEGGLGEGEARAALDAVLAPGVALPAVLRTLRALTERHGVRCTEDDVRRVVLCVGSVAALQLILRSSPDLQIVGLDIFERRFDPRFAGLKINDDGLKRCLKAVLARGARLGQPSSVPASKLLRKLDVDASPAWAARFLESMAQAGWELPEPLQARVEAFL
mmetsp:Transcript_2657/g.7933  ORF Transcript_2657/g.7933 Transcript_2657/m.7933 type:complete len:306 (-) Transcript_2657:112-1029(-)